MIIQRRNGQELKNLYKLAMDRDKWLGFVESAGMAQAVKNWMESNRKEKKG